MLGLYGVLAFSVGQRTREIGIRMAWVRKRLDVLRLVVAQGLRLALAAWRSACWLRTPQRRLMKSLLYGVSATDPLTFAAIALLLTTVALWLVGSGASGNKVDPMVALRCQ